MAVNNISFGVRAHECFGVLGVNGAGEQHFEKARKNHYKKEREDQKNIEIFAGKSSTFEILTGNTLPTGGSASVNGIDCGRAPVSSPSGNNRLLRF